MKYLKEKKEFEETIYIIIAGVLTNGFIQGQTKDKINPAVIGEAKRQLEIIFQSHDKNTKRKMLEWVLDQFDINLAERYYSDNTYKAKYNRVKKAVIDKRLQLINQKLKENHAI